ncbi:hypothetical protein CHLRE_10g440700v5 [Chlamydomonas reinhardtii]|uniref:CREG-like beta-barrel domain-containing protein n=1 Tax=Chlamydomonas reinhardtii TaxID=3055 RepID=A0A2K3DAH2_CHLRE|nr:uncharacterized protein CHLRE_10g440700v5 [Chlamydomonas reinhardtii]PNW77530.1 hypothetical protein CHLRE_10g440700v5 [Chlamydomonas reinhardtii]
MAGQALLSRVGLTLTLAIVAAGSVDARPGSLWKWLTGDTPGNSDDAAVVSFPRPPYEERAKMARWLVHETTYGVLSTVDRQSGEAIGGVVSHSDGSRDHATGRIFFYLTPMDELTQNALSHPRCTFTVSEMQRRSANGGSSSSSSSSSDGHRNGNGPCGALDPEDPACARATFVGRVLPVPEQDRSLAQAAMFSRHPAMADWPTGHQFDFYELHVNEVHVLDWYGGMSVVDSNEYYSADVSYPASSTSGSSKSSMSGSTAAATSSARGHGKGRTGTDSDEVVLTGPDSVGYRIVIPAKRLRGHA